MIDAPTAAKTYVCEHCKEVFSNTTVHICGMDPGFDRSKRELLSNIRLVIREELERAFKERGL